MTIKHLSDVVGMKNWDDDQQCWVGVICRIVEENGEQKLHVYDTNKADTQVEIDDWIKLAIAAVKKKGILTPEQAEELRKGMEDLYGDL